MRPLYRTDGEPKTRPPSGHAGLWFDKFCNTWRSESDVPVMSATDKCRDKLRWIKTVTGEMIGDRKQIGEHARRQARLVRGLGGRFAVLVTESRFVTGLGRSHPVENGFAWHPILGTPFLPGSSLKGLLLSWAKQNEGLAPEMKARLFGGAGQAGGVCFFDAVPTGPVRLEADVMTPHHGGWTPKEPPGDWRSPTPIPFLVTAPGTPFLFGFAPRQRLDDGDLDLLSTWLCAALEWAGSGAKTAIGYGRFHHDGTQTRHWSQIVEEEERTRLEKLARAEASSTPEGRWRLKLEDKSEDETLDMVRVYLEKKTLADPGERQAFARAVSMLRPDWLDAWRSGRAGDPRTVVGRRKRKERAQLIERELAGTGSNGSTENFGK